MPAQAGIQWTYRQNSAVAQGVQGFAECNGSSVARFV